MYFASQEINQEFITPGYPFHSEKITVNTSEALEKYTLLGLCYKDVYSYEGENVASLSFTGTPETGEYTVTFTESVPAVTYGGESVTSSYDSGTKTLTLDDFVAVLSDGVDCVITITKATKTNAYKKATSSATDGSSDALYFVIGLTEVSELNTDVEIDAVITGTINGDLLKIDTSFEDLTDLRFKLRQNGLYLRDFTNAI